MCGIAGIINFNKSEEKEALLREMVGLIRHRGPDAAGMYLSGPIGLAHARLSIIDLESGDQPIHNEDRSIWVVFNGEIFNYLEICEDLKAKGHRFYTRTDTETLVHLYEEYGPDLFGQLNGQFAFALWDQKRERLLLGRDRVGIRPLFYHIKDGRLIFGSEIKALFADRNIERSFNPQTLSDIFTSWAPIDSSTAFKGIFQIPPGHYTVYSRQGLDIQPYWGLTFDDTNALQKSVEEWTEELRFLLYDATRIRLRADVPVGTYLSGGLDSTYTTSIVRRNFNNALRTFSVRFADKRFDETVFQDQAVHVLKTEHCEIICKEKDIGETFPKIIWHTEVPILRTAPTPLYHLSKLVRDNNFKVVLTGEGADELFAGYNIFKEDRVRRFWARRPDSRLRPRLLERLYPYVFSQGDGKAKVYLESFFKKGLSKTDSPAYSHMLRWKNTSQLRTFFSPDILQQTGTLDDFIQRYQISLPKEFVNWHHLSRAQFTEIRIFLSNYLLSSQGDRMAMAHSVEGRHPFLDHRLIEFACRIPPRLRLNGLSEKYILKQAAMDTLPKELIQRPKQPYRAPISRCFFGDTKLDYVEDLLSEECLQRAGYFDSQKVSRLIAKCHSRAGHLLSERENMALCGILSTQLLDHLFIRNFPPYPVKELENVKIFYG